MEINLYNRSQKWMHYYKAFGLCSIGQLPCAMFAVNYFKSIIFLQFSLDLLETWCIPHICVYFFFHFVVYHLFYPLFEKLLQGECGVVSVGDSAGIMDNTIVYIQICWQILFITNNQWFFMVHFWPGIFSVTPVFNSLFHWIFGPKTLLLFFKYFFHKKILNEN